MRPLFYINQNAKKRLLILLAVLLVLFTFSSQKRLLPQNFSTESSMSGAPHTALYAVTGIVFQVMENSREAGGLKSSESVKEKETRGLLFLRAQLLLALTIVLAAFRLSPPTVRGKSFPFQNSAIHSRWIIVRYLKRQDGRKRIAL